MKQLLIDGRLVDAPRTFPTTNPATGEVFDQAPDATVGQAEEAVLAARRAFDTTSWSTDLKQRIECLHQLHQALTKHKEELRELTITEVGAPRMNTYGPGLDEPLELVHYYAELAAAHAFTEALPDIEVRGEMHRRWVEKEAIGVVSAIIAYNYPTQLALVKLAPALAAGCTVILKGAPDTPLVTLALGEIIATETDIPAGVVNVLSSSEVSVGELLTTHPAVDMVSFTGSTATGRAIMAAASATVKKVFLELGGKSAMIMLDDVEVATPAMIAAATICSHSGQGCAITSRLLVPRSRHDEIVEAVAGALAHIPVGDPQDPNTYMGPLISGRQRDKVDAMVQRAVAGGATLVTGGRPIDPGFFYAPTLLTGVSSSDEIAQDEVFGPVLAVIPFDDDEDAVRIANDSIFGLSGGVYSQDPDRALAVARRIRTGTVGVNGGMWFAHDAPFGGYKQSGIGREMGVPGIEEFQERKIIAMPVS